MRPFVFILAAALTAPGAASAEKILVSPSTGKATVVSLTGPDTAKAAATFRQDKADAAAACFERDEIHTRYAPDPAAAREKLRTDCAAKAAPDSRTLTRTADCTRLIVSMEPDYVYLGGVFVLKKYAPENGAVRTTWKAVRGKGTIANCLTCGSPEINDAFRVLCPAAYKAKFGGLEPF